MQVIAAVRDCFQADQKRGREAVRNIRGRPAFAIHYHPRDGVPDDEIGKFIFVTEVVVKGGGPDHSGVAELLDRDLFEAFQLQKSSKLPGQCSIGLLYSEICS